MELHEICEKAMKTEKIKNLTSYLKNFTSSPLNTAYDLLRVADTIWTEVNISELENIKIN